MSDARDLFTQDPQTPGPAEAILHELALIRLNLENIQMNLEAVRADVAVIREEVEAFTAAPPPPAAEAPLAAGGRASYPGFPASLRGRGW